MQFHAKTNANLYSLPLSCVYNLLRVLQDHAGIASQECYSIVDAYSRPHFVLAAATSASLHAKRQLLNASNNTAVLSIERKLFSLHGSWLISRPGEGGRLAKAQPEGALSVARPSVRVFLKRKSTTPDFVIKVGSGVMAAGSLH
jgi:hypothetical protein